MNAQPSSARRNGHDTSHQHTTSLAEVQCPYCGQSISRQEFREIQARMQEEQAEGFAQREQQMRDGFEREMQRAETRWTAAIEKVTRDAAATSEKRLEALRKTQDAVVAARVAKEREKAAKEVSKAVTQERLQHAAEKLKLEQKLEDLKRRVQAKTANAIGEPGEIDLHATLVAAYPADRVSRVPKGAPGADVIFEVVEHGEVCGKIILDSKRHKTWKNDFSRKLRQDQLAVGADFAILVSEVFWAGAPQHVALRDSIVVSTIERVPVLVGLLRQIVVDNHKLKLSASARDEKEQKALAFLVSPTCNDLTDRWLQLSNDLGALDLTEEKAHRATWSRRAELIQGMIALREKFSRTVADIIGGGV